MSRETLRGGGAVSEQRQYVLLMILARADTKSTAALCVRAVPQQGKFIPVIGPLIVFGI